jgi:Pyruvate kinase, barrel domain
VATAIYEGADAIMLSAESVAGKFPVEAVSTMNRIGEEVERDPTYREAGCDFDRTYRMAVRSVMIGSFADKRTAAIFAGPCGARATRTECQVVRQRWPFRATFADHANPGQGNPLGPSDQETSQSEGFSLGA